MNKKEMQEAEDKYQQRAVAAREQLEAAWHNLKAETMAAQKEYIELMGLRHVAKEARNNAGPD